MPSVSYEDALERICSLDKFGSRLGLSRIKKMLKLLGEPQKKYRCILVGGSNGKGSTVEMIGSALCREGWGAGTYFSPQVVEFAERIRVDGKNAGRKEIASAYDEVMKKCGREVPDATFFEVVTAIALLIFAKRKVDFAVLEVGLGGRLDATNAVEPEISAITSVSLEHTDVLGKTIGAIAHEKCGIARKGMPLVCGKMSSEASAAVKKECRMKGAIPYFVGEDVEVENAREHHGKYSFDALFSGERYRLSLSAPGEWQVSNAAVAAAVCALAGANKNAIEKGVSEAVPAFRLQMLGGKPLVVADCAHNPEAAGALALEVREMKAEKKVLLFSAMKDKEYGKVLSSLSREFDGIVITEVNLARAAKLKGIGKEAKQAGIHVRGEREPHAALLLAKKLAGRNGLVVIAGSIYLLAELFGRDKIRVAQ